MALVEALHHQAIPPSPESIPRGVGANDKRQCGGRTRGDPDPSPASYSGKNSKRQCGGRTRGTRSPALTPPVSFSTVASGRFLDQEYPGNGNPIGQLSRRKADEWQSLDMPNGSPFPGYSWSRNLPEATAEKESGVARLGSGSPRVLPPHLLLQFFPEESGLGSGSLETSTRCVFCPHAPEGNILSGEGYIWTHGALRGPLRAFCSQIIYQEGRDGQNRFNHKAHQIHSQLLITIWLRTIW